MSKLSDPIAEWLFGGFPFYNTRKNFILLISLSLIGMIIGLIGAAVEEKTRPSYKYEFVKQRGLQIDYTRHKNCIERLKQLRTIEHKAGFKYEGECTNDKIRILYNKSIVGVRIVDTIDNEYIKFRAIRVDSRNSESRFTGYTHISNICFECSSKD